MGEPKNWLARMADTAANTEINPLTLAWRMLPPEARKAYGSLPSALAELTPGAAVRDAVTASGETANALTQGRGWDAASGAVNMLAAAAGVLPGSRLITKGAKELAQPIRAYHGSPHDFDKFDLSKIGTGEGAQAYGHGLYFAEQEGIAKGYKNTLSPTIQTKSPLDHIETRTAQTAMSFGGGPAGAVEWINKNRGVVPALTDNVADSVIAKIKSGEITPGGRMYEVNIHADPNKFLDWDKPLSGQGEVASRMLEIPSVAKQNAHQVSFLGPDAELTGRSAYSAAANWKMGSQLSPPDAAGTTNMLRNLGIPGIKYLDGGSRAAGQGSSNYVAFDDKMIEILRKYGLLPAAAGGAAVGVNAFAPNGGESY